MRPLRLFCRLRNCCSLLPCLVIYTPKLLFCAGVRTLDDVTIISQATAQAIHILKQEEEGEREEIISCTTSTTPSVRVMICLTLLHLHMNIDTVPFDTTMYGFDLFSACRCPSH